MRQVNPIIEFFNVPFYFLYGVLAILSSIVLIVHLSVIAILDETIQGVKWLWNRWVS